MILIFIGFKDIIQCTIVKYILFLECCSVSFFSVANLQCMAFFFQLWHALPSCMHQILSSTFILLPSLTIKYEYRKDVSKELVSRLGLCLDAVQWDCALYQASLRVEECYTSVRSDQVDHSFPHFCPHAGHLDFSIGWFSPQNLHSGWAAAEEEDEAGLWLAPKEVFGAFRAWPSFGRLLMWLISVAASWFQNSWLSGGCLQLQ